MTAEQDGTTTIEVRLAIRRDVVASFKPDILSLITGIPEEVLLTSVDSWTDDQAENFLDNLLAEEGDGGLTGQSVQDWSTLEKYTIKEKQ